MPKMADFQRAITVCFTMQIMKKELKEDLCVFLIIYTMMWFLASLLTKSDFSVLEADKISDFEGFQKRSVHLVPKLSITC